MNVLCEYLVDVNVVDRDGGIFTRIYRSFFVFL